MNNKILCKYNAYNNVNDEALACKFIMALYLKDHKEMINTLVQSAKHQQSILNACEQCLGTLLHGSINKSLKNVKEEDDAAGVIFL